MPEPLVAGWRWGTAGELVAIALAVMGSPGPATISLTAAGSVHGVRRVVRYLAGIVAGTEVVLLAVAAGITTALAAVPSLRLALLAASAAYIAWLAYHIATAPPLSRDGRAARPLSFRGGALLGVANPKAWVAIAAVFSSVRLTQDRIADATAKVVLLSVLILVINLAWLLAGASIAPFLRDPRRARVTNVVMAAALVGFTALALVR